MKTSKKLIDVLLFTGLCTAAMQVMASPTRDWYAGVKAGWSDYYNSNIGKNLSSGANSDYKLHGSNAVGGIFLGYQALDWMEIEGGYDYLGNASFSNSTSAGASFKGQGIQMSLKMNLPLTEIFSIYGRLGMMGWTTQVESSGHTNTDNGVSPLAAVGTELSFSNQFALRLEYQYTNNVGNGGDDGVVLDNGQTTLGVVYNFGSHKSDTVSEAPIPVTTPVEKSVKLDTSVHFESGSSKLTENEKYSLHEWLKKINSKHLAKVRVIVTGYADRTAYSEGNQFLSEERANQVADELRKNTVSKMSLIATGKGVSTQSGVICDKSLNRMDLAQCLSPDRRVDVSLTANQKLMR